MTPLSAPASSSQYMPRRFQHLAWTDPDPSGKTCAFGLVVRCATLESGKLRVPFPLTDPARADKSQVVQ
jgi:hypothetical protein